MKTLQITPYEQIEIDAIIDVLKSYYFQKHLAAKTEFVLYSLRMNKGITISPQTFRKHLGLIRKYDLASPGFIVSNVNLGYWLTEDKEEMNDYLQQELNRMSNQFANVEALRTRLILNKPRVEHQQMLMFNG